jgi:hypothetical protein
MFQEFAKGGRQPLSFLSFLACVPALTAVFLLPYSASAQQALYPLQEGIIQPLHVSEVPSWMTLDFELRGRTEEQTALTEIQGKDRLYMS